MEAYRKPNLTVLLKVASIIYLSLESRCHVVLLCVPSKYQWWEALRTLL